jgi:hypothetical protein
VDEPYAMSAPAMNALYAHNDRPFALMCTGQTSSRQGENLDRVALAWWVLGETASAVAMGTVFVLYQIPVPLFLLVEGMVVDAEKEWRVVRE